MYQVISISVLYRVHLLCNNGVQKESKQSQKNATNAKQQVNAGFKQQSHAWESDARPSPPLWPPFTVCGTCLWDIFLSLFAVGESVTDAQGEPTSCSYTAVPCGSNSDERWSRLSSKLLPIFVEIGCFTTNMNYLTVCIVAEMFVDVGFMLHSHLHVIIRLSSDSFN